MAISFDNSAGVAFTSSVFTTTYSHTVTGANPTLFLFIMVSSSTDILTTVTYNSVAMTLIQKVHDAGNGNGDIWFYQYWLPNASTGAHNVSFTTSSAAFTQAASASYTGCDNVTQPDGTFTETHNSVSTSDITDTITTTTAGDWGIMFVGMGRTPVASTGSTARTATSNGQSGLYDSNGAFGSIGSNSMAYHANVSGGGNSTSIMTGIKAAAAATSTTNPAFLLNFI